MNRVAVDLSSTPSQIILGQTYDGVEYTPGISPTFVYIALSAPSVSPLSFSRGAARFTLIHYIKVCSPQCLPEAPPPPSLSLGFIFSRAPRCFMRCSLFAIRLRAIGDSPARALASSSFPPSLRDRAVADSPTHESEETTLRNVAA